MMRLKRFSGGVVVKLDSRIVMDAAYRLSCLKFFPSHPAGVAEVAATIHEFAENESQVNWLVHEMKARFDEWPGPKTLRAIHCSRYKPADGVEATIE